MEERIKGPWWASPHLLPVVIIIGAVLLITGKYLLYGVPHEFITGEYKGTFEGDYDFTLELVRSFARWKTLPLWSETFSGPIGVFASNLHVFAQAVLYPFTRDLALSIKILQVCQIVTAGIGMYALANHVFKDRLGAVFSAVLYMFTPFYIGHLLSYLHYTGVYMLAPLVYLFTLKTIRERSVASALALALTAAVSFLMHPQNVFIGGLFYTIFFVLVLAHELVSSARQRTALRAAGRLVPLGLLVVLIGALLTAFLVLPTLTDNYPYMRTSWVAGAEGLVKVDTGHIGTHSQNLLATITLQHWPWFQTPLKGGVYPPWPRMAVYLIPFAFAVGSILLRFDWLSMVFVVMAAVSVQLSLGVNGSPDLFTLASRHIPFFGMSRTPYSYVTTAILVFCLFSSVTFSWLLARASALLARGRPASTSLFSWVFLGVFALPYLSSASYYGVEYNWTFIPSKKPAYLEQVWSWMDEFNTERGRAIETCGIPTAMILGSRMLPNQVDLLERFARKGYLDRYLALLGLNYVITPRLHSQRAVTFDKKGYMVPSVFDPAPSMEEYYSALTTEYYHIFERLSLDPAFTLHTAGTKDVAVFELNDPIPGYELYPAQAVMVLGGVDSYDLLTLSRFAFKEGGSMPPAPVFIAQEENLKRLTEIAAVSNDLVMHNTDALDLYVTLNRDALTLFQPRPVDPALWDLSIYSFGIQQPFPQHDHAIGNSLFGELTYAAYSVTSRVKGAMLKQAFTIDSPGRYAVMLRSYGGPARSAVGFVVDGTHGGTIDQSGAAGYRWHTLWEGELSPGEHSVELTVAGEKGVYIDSVLVIDQTILAAGSIVNTGAVAAAGHTYIQNHKRFVVNDDTDGTASTVVLIGTAGDYTPSLRLGTLANPDPPAARPDGIEEGEGALRLLVDGAPVGSVPYGAISSEVKEFTLPPLTLTSGPHTFTLAGLAEGLHFDLLALSARGQGAGPGSQGPPDGFGFEEVGPSKYALKMRTDRPVFVVFNETNYPGWSLSYGAGSAGEVRPVITNMFLNGFIVEPGEGGREVEARIAFSNRHQNTGVLLSGGTLLVVLAGLAVSAVLSVRVRRRGRKGRGGRPDDRFR